MYTTLYRILFSRRCTHVFKIVYRRQKVVILDDFYPEMIPWFPVFETYYVCNEEEFIIILFIHKRRQHFPRRFHRLTTLIIHHPFHSRLKTYFYKSFSP